ncbi:MAG: transglutaminase-like domain-containing protein [Methanobacteriaceae archaeon]
MLFLIVFLSLSSVNAVTDNNNNNNNNNDNNSLLSNDNIITSDINNINTKALDTEINKNTDSIIATSLAKNTSKNSTTSPKTTTNSSKIGNAAAGEPSSLSQAQILAASTTIKNYVAKNGKLPNYITIASFNFSMPEFLYLITKASSNAYKNNKGSIDIVYDINNPGKASGQNIINKYFTKANYYSTANSVSNYIAKNKQAPNYASTSLGKIQYQTLIYTYAQILDYYKTYKKLPTSQKINIKTTSALNTNLPKYTRTTSQPLTSKNSVPVSEIIKATTVVKNYIDSYQKLPSTITINNNSYTISQYTYLISKAIYNLNKGNLSNIALLSVSGSSSYTAYDVIGTISKANYATMANNVANYISTYKKVPNYVSSSLKVNIQSQTFAYIFTMILDQRNKNGQLPESILLNIKKANPLKNVSTGTNTNNTNNNTNTNNGTNNTNNGTSTGIRTSVPLKDIITAAASVKSFIDTSQGLPNYVTINGFQYNMYEFAYLTSKTIVNLNKGNLSNILLISPKAPLSPSGNTITGNIDKADYIDMAQRIASFIENNNQIPNYASTSLGKNLRYQAFLYTLSEVLSVVNSTGSLPDYVFVNDTVSTTSTPSTSDKNVNEKYNGEILANYLKATKNCQVGDSAITSLANSLISGLKTDQEKAVAIYNYVRDKIGYSFYYDTKYGAKGTLNAKAGNCVDQAHLLVAMYRSVGLATRYVHGVCKFSSGSTYGHVWVQVLVGDTWTVADPTSSRNSLGVVNNWNTATYTLKSKYIELPF